MTPKMVSSLSQKCLETENISVLSRGLKKSFITNKRQKISTNDEKYQQTTKNIDKRRKISTNDEKYQ